MALGQIERILILAKTYPSPSTQYVETSPHFGCVSRELCLISRSAKLGSPNTESMSKESNNDGGLFHQRPLQAA